MALETIIGDLRAYSRLKPGTFLHADQLTAEQLRAEQVRNYSLLDRAFYVADGPIYSLEGWERTPTLFLTREPDNLVLRHLNDEVNSSFDQLVSTGNFRPDREEVKEAMRARGTLRIDLTKLRLLLNGERSDAEWCFVEIDDHKPLNREERKLSERFYGRGGIGSSTRVYVLNPNRVRKEAEVDPLVLVARRGSVNNGAYSFAVDRGFALSRGYGVSLRGVPRASEVHAKA